MDERQTQECSECLSRSGSLAHCWKVTVSMVEFDHVCDLLTHSPTRHFASGQAGTHSHPSTQDTTQDPACSTHSGESQSGQKRKGLQINKMLLQPTITTYFRMEKGHAQESGVLGKNMG